MSLAWATVALVTFLLPGLLFFVGLTFPEQFTRENARKSPLGQMAGAVFISFFLHGAAFYLLQHVAAQTGWTGATIRLDYVLAAFQLEGAEADISTVDLARNLSEHSLQILLYFGVLCGAGWLVGVGTGNLVVQGKLSFLARHGWVYKMRSGVSLAYVLTHKERLGRHLLYHGVLRDFGLKDDGTFSYVILEKVTRGYLRMDRTGAVTEIDGVSPMNQPGGGASFLAIEGEDVANLVVIPGLSIDHFDDKGLAKLEQALADKEGAPGGPAEAGRSPSSSVQGWWTSPAAYLCFGLGSALGWVVGIHRLDPVRAVVVGGLVGVLALGLWRFLPVRSST